MAIWPTEVDECSTKPLHKHSLGGCTVDMTLSNCRLQRGGEHIL